MARISNWLMSFAVLFLGGPRRTPLEGLENMPETGYSLLLVFNTTTYIPVYISRDIRRAVNTFVGGFFSCSPYKKRKTHPSCSTKALATIERKKRVYILSIGMWLIKKSSRDERPGIRWEELKLLFFLSWGHHLGGWINALTYKVSLIQSKRCPPQKKSRHWSMAPVKI